MPVMIDGLYTSVHGDLESVKQEPLGASYRRHDDAKWLRTQYGSFDIYSARLIISAPDLNAETMRV
jgi:hypothetical protein